MARTFRHRSPACRRSRLGPGGRAVEGRRHVRACALGRVDQDADLARDRFGEKPLYYGWAGKDFLFGSELKALRLHPGFDNPVSRRALGSFASRAYVPAPLSIFERIYKLPPGCMLTVSREACWRPRDEPLDEGKSGKGLRLAATGPIVTWSARGLADPIADEREALEALEQGLATAIRDQSVADVPVGAFLSGGIDSSTIVALYQQSLEHPGADLHDRLRGGGIRRGWPCQGRRGAAWDGPPRISCHGA